MIDNSSAFRMKKNIPLVVPEINADQIKQTTKRTKKKSPQTHGKGNRGIIANPNCSTIQLVLALYPLQAAFGLKSVCISSYQSLSGAGQSALNLLKKESQAILNKEQALSLPLHKISSAFNCIPQIGTINEEGFSTEEAKLMRETKKILNQSDLKIVATAVRVPTFNGHGEAINVTLKKSARKEDLISALEKGKGLKVLEEQYMPNQRFVDGKNDVYVGRIRMVPEEKGKTWMMWVAADNLRKGAALNGLQIAEFLISSGKA